MIRLLVVDDHPLFRDGLVGLLATVDDTKVVDAVGDGESAVRSASRHRPDVVLMDLNLPGTSGLEATRRIVATCPGVTVLVLTMVDDDASVVAALEVGARGYLLRGAAQEEVLAGIRTVAAGGVVLGPGAARRMLAGRPGGRGRLVTRARPDPAGGRGARPDRSGTQQPGDQPRARGQPQDRAEPRLPGARQAAGPGPDPGGVPGSRAVTGPGAPAVWVLAGAREWPGARESRRARFG